MERFTHFWLEKLGGGNMQLDYFTIFFKDPPNKFTKLDYKQILEIGLKVVLEKLDVWRKLILVKCILCHGSWINIVKQLNK